MLLDLVLKDIEFFDFHIPATYLYDLWKFLSRFRKLFEYLNGFSPLSLQGWNLLLLSRLPCIFRRVFEPGLREKAEIPLESKLFNFKIES